MRKRVGHMNDFEKAMALVLSEGLDTIEQLTDEQLTEALERGLFDG